MFYGIGSEPCVKCEPTVSHMILIFLFLFLSFCCCSKCFFVNPIIWFSLNWKWVRACDCACVSCSRFFAMWSNEKSVVDTSRHYHLFVFVKRKSTRFDIEWPIQADSFRMPPWELSHSAVPIFKLHFIMHYMLHDVLCRFNWNYQIIQHPKSKIQIKRKYCATSV